MHAKQVDECRLEASKIPRWCQLGFLSLAKEDICLVTCYQFIWNPRGICIEDCAIVALISYNKNRTSKFRLEYEIADSESEGASEIEGSFGCAICVKIKARSVFYFEGELEPNECFLVLYMDMESRVFCPTTKTHSHANVCHLSYDPNANKTEDRYMHPRCIHPRQVRCTSCVEWVDAMHRASSMHVILERKLSDLRRSCIDNSITSMMGTYLNASLPLNKYLIERLTPSERRSVMDHMREYATQIYIKNWDATYSLAFQEYTTKRSIACRAIADAYTQSHNNSTNMESSEVIRTFAYTSLEFSMLENYRAYGASGISAMLLLSEFTRGISEVCKV